MPQHVIERALEIWPDVAFTNAYGLTETSSTISVLGPEDHRAAAHDQAARIRLASAGKALPTVTIEIRDEEGAGVAPGEPGRIWVRGDQIAGEYAGLGDGLDENGFFDTRDNGRLDAGGYLYVLGRADDTIIRGGENIAPAEIEDVLLGHEAVFDAVVVGLPDPEWGQRLAAVLVARPDHRLDVDEVRDHARSVLRGSKTPEHIEVWNDLPRTETGKILRRAVVERLVENGQGASHRPPQPTPRT
jgi:acyl-CoA synthetase (AMP-forming)/AMP-acid ligase II